MKPSHPGSRSAQLLISVRSLLERHGQRVANWLALAVLLALIFIG